MPSENAKAHTARRLDALTHAGAGRIAAHVLVVVVAHPDDETMGCGARARMLVGRLAGGDGRRPRNLADAHHQGFRCARDYA
jgi:N-acetylglucosamine malate deacetylase 2